MIRCALRPLLHARQCAVVALLALIVAGCTPSLRPAGPPIDAPRLTDSAAITADGTHLPLRQWLPPDDQAPEAIVLALHGFNDYSRAFEDPAPLLAAHGLTVYAYDQRGFGATGIAGRWAGTETMVNDMRVVANLLQVRHPDLPLVLLGESMGGAVLLAAAREGKLPGERIILVAPAVRGRATMNPVYRAALWLSAHLMPWAEATGRGLRIRASDNRDAIIKLRDDPLVIKSTRVDTIWGLVNLMDDALAGAGNLSQDVLTLYGAHDMLIPEAATALLARRLGPDSRWAVYDTGWHMLLRDHGAPLVLDDIASWINSPENSLPSGAEQRANGYFTPRP